MPPLLKFRHEAMATVFEIILCSDDMKSEYAAQVAQAAFTEIDRLEDELSRFRPASDIWRINQLLSGQRTLVGLATLDCLTLAQAVYAETGGAFDITIGPLMTLYRDSEGRPRTPHEEEEQGARSRVGAHVFDVEVEGWVTVHTDLPVLDLGAVGKGYALDQVASLLLDWSVPNALLNAGDSSVLAMGAPAGETGWTVTLGNAEKKFHQLRDRAVSGSGFQVQGNHIMNPRLLRPMPVQTDRVWALAPTAALSDALSTAFTVMSREEIAEFCSRHPEVQAVLD
jgi:FAD:protein FMN transferase